MSLVWGHAEAEGNALLVLLALADFSDDGGRCWPSMATIARKARVSTRGARAIIRRLEGDGLLVCEPSKGRSSNHYRITINAEAASGINAEAASGLEPLNPEDSDTQPGSGLPPNHQEPSIEKSLKKDYRKSSKSKKPVAALSPILGDELASAVIEHRQRIRKPLTFRAAEMLAKQFGKYHDPPAGAEAMLARGWQGFKAEWMEERNHRRSKADDLSDKKTEMARRRDERAEAYRGMAGETGGSDVVALLPAQPFRGNKPDG